MHLPQRHQDDYADIRELEKFHGAWKTSYELFAGVVNRLDLQVGAELGVAFGGHAESLLRNTRLTRLYGVDPYRHRKNYDDPMNLPREQFNRLHRYMRERLSPYGSRYVHLRMRSDEAVGHIDGQIDFVYVDADHSYAGVWNDLVAWYPKIRDGGVIGGHDYGHVSFPGVQRAVDEFFRRFAWEIHDEGEGVWWVQKKPLAISFVMPAYDARETISEALSSIFEDNIAAGDEVIVVDDCSTDGTADVVRALRASHLQINQVTHETNRGGGAARNTAVRAAANELVFCLDSDNLLIPGSIPRLKEFLIRSGADIAVFNTLKYFRTTPDNVTHEWKYVEGDTTLQGALSTYKFPGSSGNYLFTRESWARAGHYPESAGALDTWGFGLRQIATGSKMKILANSFYLHRYGHDSYWWRESRKGTVSAIAFELVSPFRDQIEDEDIEYMTSPAARDNWFDRLSTRPIRVKSEFRSRRRRLRRLLGR